MDPGTKYFRTRQHVVPAGVPSETRVVEHGWGLLCINFRAMRSGSAQRIVDNGGFGGVLRQQTGMARIELLRFQMAVGVAGDEDEEQSMFHDLAAIGAVRLEDGEGVLRAWCESGAIPQGFKLAGSPNEMPC